MFIGRERELDFLQERYDSERAELIVLYGRRRIGKTELLQQFARDKSAVFYACTECTDQEQLARFSKRILQTGIPAAHFLTSFSDWETALRSIQDVPSEGKKLLIIDEFPYMCASHPELPSILQNLWDHELSQANVMLILCGSAMSFIENELLAERNPLYGRATGIYKLPPLPFVNVREFFPQYSVEDQVAVYAILGGIPYYLIQFQPQKSLEENICTNILQKGCVLYSEVEFLLRQELRETSVYNAIIEAVALGNNTLALIHSKTQIEKTKISVYLKNLMEIGIVTREFSVLSTVKERAGSGRGLYQLTDAYFRFWYAFLYGSHSELEAGDAAGVWEHLISPQLHEFTSRAYEQICIEYLRSRNRANDLPFHFVKIGRWWEKVTHTTDGKRRTVSEEIDIVAADRAARNFLLAECKFRHTPADLDVLRQLQGKWPQEKYPGNYHYMIFSFYGFTERLRDVAAQENVCLVSGEDL